jgi:outer membrane lipoprotein-sorting protein
MSTRVQARVLAVALLLLAGAVRAEELDGRQIMEKMREMRRSKDAVTEISMTIHTGGGGERIREIRSYGKKYGEVDKALMRFLSPTEVKGAGFLVWGQEDRPDDQWLYLPELRRVKKIAVNGRNGSFMGSDFSYRDLEDRSPDEADHTLLRSEACGQVECYVVESIDKDQEAAVYSKSQSWVRKDTFVPVKIDLYDKKEEHYKTATFEDYEKVKETWVAKKVTMENLKKGTRTVMEIKSVKIDEGLGDEYFTQQYLERGE